MCLKIRSVSNRWICYPWKTVIVELAVLALGIKQGNRHVRIDPCYYYKF